jgi:hypothetical protein
MFSVAFNLLTHLDKFMEKRVTREWVKAKVHELCPDLDSMGIYPIVLGKGHRY